MNETLPNNEMVKKRYDRKKDTRLEVVKGLFVILAAVITAIIGPLVVAHFSVLSDPDPTPPLVSTTATATVPFPTLTQPAPTATATTKASSSPTLPPAPVPLAAPTRLDEYPVQGEVRLMYVYPAGSREEQALLEAVSQLRQANPGARITVWRNQTADWMMEFRNAVNGGNGPDLLLAPASKLDTLVEENLISHLSGLVDLKYSTAQASGGMHYSQTLYGVPLWLHSVALYYDRSILSQPPASLDELLQLAKSGWSIAIFRDAAYLSGFAGAYGGEPLGSRSMSCDPNRTGWPAALEYLQQLHSVSPQAFYSSLEKADLAFQNRQANMIINGPEMLPIYRSALQEDLAVVPLPGASNPARPLVSSEGLYISRTAENIPGVVAVLLSLASQEAEQLYAGAGFIPADRRVISSDQLLQGFMQSAANGFSRPPTPQMELFLRNIAIAIGQVLDQGVDPTEAVILACNDTNVIIVPKQD